MTLPLVNKDFAGKMHCSRNDYIENVSAMNHTRSHVIHELIMTRFAIILLHKLKTDILENVLLGRDVMLVRVDMCPTVNINSEFIQEIP
jgi:hypothetical protein